jgi:hypothetical protein
VKKKILAVDVAIVAIVAIGGIAYLVLSSPAHITIAYSLIHGTENITANDYPLIDKIGYNGIVTWVLFYLNITTTKSTTLNLNDCYIKCDNQSLTVMNENAGPINLQSGQIIAGSVGFILEGNITGNFQLVYNGKANVNIANS